MNNLKLITTHKDYLLLVDTDPVFEEDEDKYLTEFWDGVQSDTPYSFLVFENIQLLKR